MSDLVLKHLAPKGYLRAAINLSNFLLVTGKDSNGNTEGVSPEMAKAWVNELGVDVKWIPVHRPGELAEAVKEEVCDIGSMGNEADRAKERKVSIP